MAFSADLETKGAVAIVTLTGDLDASTAPTFKEAVEKASAASAKRLVLDMKGLNYMASAGLRVLIFAKQKMGVDADIYLIGLQEMVKETVEKTGYSQSVIILDEYDAAQIEAI